MDSEMRNCPFCGERCATLEVTQGDKWGGYVPGCLEVRTGYNDADDAPWRAEAIAAIAALDATPPETADERQAAIVARLGPGEFFADGDRFDLVFRPGGGSYSGADVIVGRFACGDTAYWLPGFVAELLNREWRR